MTDQLSSLQQQYITALRAYVHHGGELALSSAYELGRRALIDGMGVLDMAALHRAAIDDVVLTAPAHERGRWSERAATFFNELLSPFEMSFRGYRAANEDLQRLNETLQKQKRSLEAVNGELLARINASGVLQLLRLARSAWAAACHRRLQLRCAGEIPRPS